MNDTEGFNNRFFRFFFKYLMKHHGFRGSMAHHYPKFGVFFRTPHLSSDLFGVPVRSNLWNYCTHFQTKLGVNRETCDELVYYSFMNYCTLMNSTPYCVILYNREPSQTSRPPWKVWGHRPYRDRGESERGGVSLAATRPPENAPRLPRLTLARCTQPRRVAAMSVRGPGGTGSRVSPFTDERKIVVDLTGRPKKRVPFGRGLHYTPSQQSFHPALGTEKLRHAFLGSLGHWL